MRRTPALLFVAVAGAALVNPPAVLPQGATASPRFPTFEYHRIDGIGSQLGQTALVDVDNDGALDWISGQAGSHRRGYLVVGVSESRSMGAASPRKRAHRRRRRGLRHQPRRPSFIWENASGANGRPTPDKWIEHVVARKPVHEVEAGDVDGDGDIDLVAKPWTEGNEHFYLRNMAR